jgi:hypothetical protein
MLPFLYNLYRFSCTSTAYRTLEIMPVLPKSKILAIPDFNFKSTSVYETMSVTYLVICHCDLSTLCKLFKYTPMLKFLKIQCFHDSAITDDELTFTNTNAVYLKQLILIHSKAELQALELLLK